MKRRKLNSKGLRKYVISQARKLQKEAALGKIEDVSKVKAQEYQAGEEADTIESDIDFMKALKIKEQKLIRQVKALREARRKLRSKIL